MEFILVEPRRIKRSGSFVNVLPSPMEQPVGRQDQVHRRAEPSSPRRIRCLRPSQVMQTGVYDGLPGPARGITQESNSRHSRCRKKGPNKSMQSFRPIMFPVGDREVENPDPVFTVHASRRMPPSLAKCLQIKNKRKKPIVACKNAVQMPLSEEMLMFPERPWSTSGIACIASHHIIFRGRVLGNLCAFRHPRRVIQRVKASEMASPPTVKSFNDEAGRKSR